MQQTGKRRPERHDNNAMTATGALDTLINNNKQMYQYRIQPSIKFQYN